MADMQDLRDAFRGMILRDLRPIVDKDGVRVGEDVRVVKEKDKGYIVYFLKGSEEKRRKAIREKLDMGNVKYTEGKDFKD